LKVETYLQRLTAHATFIGLLEKVEKLKLDRKGGG
jgi:hypothetical protein